ncbi:hypothetical protein [Micromonospora mirobrigensis]|uniref:Terminase small subunit n=1 Tax=Micromonospora mirobrigensis TaxID=262898 RepID=A0A1C5AID7_9ACTN|nr:hypothetical protein [Micromonospora mirobrigensis]SCF44977.1 hypothetical protein GA0070564_11116 [Micromonospora mirobrigensis]
MRNPDDYSRERDQVRAERNAAPVFVLRGEGQVLIPPADPEWHQVARDMWLALMDSPQAGIMTGVDWAYARFCFGELSAYLNGDYASRGRTKGKSAVALDTVDRLLRGVIIPPADRLRLRVAIEPPPPPAPHALTLDEIDAAISEAEGEANR